MLMHVSTAVVTMAAVITRRRIVIATVVEV
jgi:hypothetical protein